MQCNFELDGEVNVYMSSISVSFPDKENLHRLDTGNENVVYRKIMNLPLKQPSSSKIFKESNRVLGKWKRLHE